MPSHVQNKLVDDGLVGLGAGTHVLAVTICRSSLPVYLMLRTVNMHAVLYFENPSKCVSGGERTAKIERRGVFRVLVLCSLVRAHY